VDAEHAPGGCPVEHTSRWLSAKSLDAEAFEDLGDLARTVGPEDVSFDDSRSRASPTSEMSLNSAKHRLHGSMVAVRDDLNASQAAGTLVGGWRAVVVGPP
jgi:hypothetical protein